MLSKTEIFNELSLDYISKLNPTLPSWMQEIKAQGVGDKIPILRDDLGQFLKFFCSLISPMRILEIGCGISYSTHWMLMGSENSHVLAIDQNRIRIAICKKYLEKSGFQNRVTLKNCWAEEFLEKNQETFDLIFVDSVKKDYINILQPCLDILDIGGFLVVDNIFFGGKTFYLAPEQEKKYKKGVTALQEFNRIVASHPQLECTFLPLGDGALIAKKVT